MYRLSAVGSWSDPDDPVAVYGPDAPPAPPPLLTAQERTWIRQQRLRQGEEPSVLVAFDSRGNMTRRPSRPRIGIMLAALGRGNEHMVLQRLGDEREGDWYVQVRLRDDNVYQLEHRDGRAAEHYWTLTVSQDKVRDALLGWAAGKADWRGGFMWNRIGAEPDGQGDGPADGG